MGQAYITRRGGGGASGRMPRFTYDGTYIETFEDDKQKLWNIKFTSSGTFTLHSGDIVVDVFAVGGGGSGGSGHGASGGAGGYTTTKKNVTLLRNRSYNIVVGAGGEGVTGQTFLPGNKGGDSSAFDVLAAGGLGGLKGESDSNLANKDGVKGGSGSGAGTYVKGQTAGAGGSDGGNGAGVGSAEGGEGQGTTTREFGASNGKLYAGGGGGSSRDVKTGAAGGEGGGGSGGSHPDSSYVEATSGKSNTGGGGGASAWQATSGSGGSGIIIIRNARS